MGIKFLQSFISRLVPDGIFPVNILDEIIEWKRYNKNCCIVIDVMGFVNILTQISIKSNVYGGNYRLVSDHLKSFLRTLCEHGATLVFFCDGPCPDQKSSTVLDRICSRFENNKTICDSIIEKPDTKDTTDTTVTTDPVNHHQKYVIKTEYFKIAMDVCKLYGKLHISFGHDCDLELAKYAIENNVMAILAHDSDFLIFEGNWRYWSIQGKQLFSNFQTDEFNRPALRRKLGLSQKQMPLLATLAGNDIIHFDEIQPIFIKNQHPMCRFYSIATFIREKIWRLPKNLIESDVKLIVETMFKDPDDDLYNLIKLSIKSYDTNVASIKYFEESTMQQKYYGHVFLSTILECQPFLLETGFYDWNENNCVILKDIILPVQRRLGGIVLKHKNDLTLVIRVLFFNKEGDLEGSISEPIYPTIDLPELNILITPAETNSTDFSEIKRFELLSWLITEDTKQLSGLNLIDKKYIIVNAVLYYLVKQKQITITEADCILSMVYAINENKINHDQIEIKVLNHRAITVAAMYEKLFFLVKNCFITLGLIKYLADIELDGIYFQYLTNVFTNNPEVVEKCINRIGSIRNFYHLCS